MIDINKIKVGDNLEILRRRDNKNFNSRNIIGEEIPSCCDSQYVKVYNLDNKKHKRYALTDEKGIIIDITEDDSKAINWANTRRSIDFILDNRCNR